MNVCVVGTGYVGLVAGTCLAVGVATEADAEHITSIPDVRVVGHPADQPEQTEALLDMLREEIS